MNPSHLAIWSIAAIATAGVVVRPRRWPEAVWAVAGAAAIVSFGLLPLRAALAAVAKGDDVYLFLLGMMLLAETARREGLFDQVAERAVRAARGSARRLFAIVYGVGVVVTVFLSNDATAVVLTPAVYAAARRARVPALPYLFVCAFVANAASFVLPISNPANLVVFGDHVPPLVAWLARFALPSVVAVGITYAALYLIEGRRLAQTCAVVDAAAPLPRGARIALAGIAVTALALSTVSAFDRPLGFPTALAGVLTAAVATLAARRPLASLVGGVAWSVLPLVGGLFVIVDALATTGLVDALGRLLTDLARHGEAIAAAIAGTTLGLASNVVNNLPAGLVASAVVQATRPPEAVVDALLIGVDLGPNLSVTGSLATILWLIAIRREGEEVSFSRFLRIGALVMPAALVAALWTRLALA